MVWDEILLLLNWFYPLAHKLESISVTTVPLPSTKCKVKLYLLLGSVWPISVFPSRELKEDIFFAQDLEEAGHQINDGCEFDFSYHINVLSESLVSIQVAVYEFQLYISCLWNGNEISTLKL